MKKIVMINSVPYGSTAKIMLGIGQLASKNGFEVFIGSGYSHHPLQEFRNPQDFTYINVNSDTTSMKHGNLTINIDKYEVRKNDEIIDLTLREFELLKFLALQPEKVFSRGTLLEKVWGYEFYGDDRTVDVTVRRLREKIESDPSAPKYVMTKRGVGYYFNGDI